MKQNSLSHFQQTNSPAGFTFVEVLTAVAVIAIIAVGSLSAFRNVYRSAAVRTATSEVKEAFLQARNNTLASKNDTVYGVHVGTSSVTRFEGGTYDPFSASNTTYAFEAGVHAAGTLVTDGVDVVFKRLTGEPSATGTIYLLDLDETSTTTVTIGATGLVQ